MAGALTLRIITPDRIALDTQVSAVQFPGVDGLIGVLPRHAHMVAAVDVGTLRYAEGGQSKGMFVSEGFAEVKDNTLRVVCQAGELPEDIDEARAREAEKRARERLAAPRSEREGIDVARAEAALHRALVRLQVLESFARGGRARS